MTEWVEVRGKTVEAAVAAGLAELGLDSPEAAEIEVLEEPQRGFLGLGGRDALVSIKAKPKRRRRRRRGKGKDWERDRSKDQGEKGRRRARSGRGRGPSDREPSRRRGGSGERGDSGARATPPGRKPAEARPRERKRDRAASAEKKETAVTVDIDEQARVVEEFLEGLLDSFGLEGGVETQIDDDIINVELTGDQTEALIGPKGSVMQAMLELTRTVVHRKTQAGARIRIDIGGYAERRREALRIYVGRLAERVRSEGGEVMLEAMNPADRKVVHDAVAEIEGVHSYSEGEEPERSVVVAADE